jgi:hypothetical protein
MTVVLQSVLHEFENLACLLSRRHQRCQYAADSKAVFAVFTRRLSFLGDPYV